tara:strand:+ start:9386 stop:9583 length:198 start_codon:yes stop_codon:yes gene_type:complete
MHNAYKLVAQCYLKTILYSPKRYRNKFKAAILRQLLKKYLKSELKLKFRKLIKEKEGVKSGKFVI